MEAVQNGRPQVEHTLFDPDLSMSAACDCFCCVNYQGLDVLVNELQAKLTAGSPTLGTYPDCARDQLRAESGASPGFKLHFN